MCEPLTIAAVSAVVAAGGIKAYSEFQAGRAEADSQSAGARAADANALDATTRAANDVGVLRARGSQVEAGQRAALASGNIALDSRATDNLFSTTRTFAELDAETARANGVREAYGFRVEAAQRRAAAKLARRQSVLGPLGTLLNTGGQAAAMGGSGGGAAKGGGGNRGLPMTGRTLTSAEYD